MFRAGSRPKEFFLSVDVAQFCLRQVLPLPRQDFLIEYFSDTVFPRIQNMGYQAVRTQRWKYIHYRDISEADELYDLTKDPYEMTNLIGDPRAPRTEMQTRLARLKDT
jgi:arylsulfatase A-like enzyme